MSETGTSDVMTTEEVRALINYVRSQDAARWARRRGIEPLGWRDRAGNLLWPGDQVREQYQAGSQRGVRRDLGYEESTGVRKRQVELDGTDRQVLAILVSDPDASVRAAKVNEEPDVASGVVHRNRLSGMERRGLVKRSQRQRGEDSVTVARVTARGREAWERDAANH